MARSLPVLLVAVALAVAACGSSHSSLPTITKTKTYHDPNLHFSFRYPADWKVPAHGAVETIAGAPTYVVRITIPGNAASAEVTVVGSAGTIPPFTNGQIQSDPTGGPNTFRLYHVKIDGLKGMRIERFAPKVNDQIDSVTYAGKKRYDVRTIAATPPFAPRTRAGYNLIVRSLKVPFS